MSRHWHNLGHLRGAVETRQSPGYSGGLRRNQPWVQRRTYLQGEGVHHLAELIRLGVERGRAVEEAPTAEHHPAGLQLLIPTVHKPPTQTGKPLRPSSLHKSLRSCFFGSNKGCFGQLQPQERQLTREGSGQKGQTTK